MENLGKGNLAKVLGVRRMLGQLQAVERVEGENGAKAVTAERAVRGAANGHLRIIEGHMHTHLSVPGLTDAERTGGVQAAIRRYAK